VRWPTPRTRRSRSESTPEAAALEREDIVAIYRQVLGRPPAEEEIAHQLVNRATLEQALRVALDSDEYRALRHHQDLREVELAPTFVNVYEEGIARWTTPPGTRSADGVAIVGREGWLFLNGGNNDLIAQYTGAYELDPDWLVRWRRLIDHRIRSAGELGVDLAMLMLPDKLTVYNRHFPLPLERIGPRPVERLLADPSARDILYPLDDLRATAAAGEEVFLRTDSHFNRRGSAILATHSLRKLGAEMPAGWDEVPLRTYPVAGDLGARFDPRLVSLYTVPASFGQARIVENNKAAIYAAGAHIGTRSVYVNEAAPDPRVLVVFGGSASYADPGYQGLSWFYSQVFREVHSIWFPFGWDSEYLRRVGAEAVVISGGDRLVVRVPREDVDTAALAADTLSRGRPVGVERIIA